MKTISRAPANVVTWESLKDLKREPDISVIIVASPERAEKYLPRAIQSVLDQTLERRLYEITVVANFRPDLTRFRGEDVKLIVLEGIPGGHMGVNADNIPATYKIAAGIDGARGSAISTLDDDDRFLPDKLGAVHEAFSNIPNLGLYVNNFRYAMQDGVQPDRLRVIRERMQAMSESLDRILVIPSEQKVAHLGFMTDIGCIFNSSRMSFLSGVVDPKIMRYIGHNPDDIIFNSAIAADGLAIALDPTKFTVYTMHGTSFASPSTLEGLVRTLTLWIEGHERQIEVFGSKVKEIGECETRDIEELRARLEKTEQELAKMQRRAQPMQ